MDSSGRNILSHWRAAAGLDFHTLATVLFRSWAVLSGTATVLFLPHFLSPPEQGYYYTFGSVLALQIFFELGLNQIITQLVSYEVAHLSLTPDGLLAGPSAHLGRLGSLAQMIRRWYAVAAVLFVMAAGLAGTVFFGQKHALPTSAWLGVWAALVISTAVNLWYSPGLAVMEGCGNIGQVARLRLTQAVASSAVFWIVLLAGGGLWACTVAPLVGAIGTAYWLRTQGRVLSWLAEQPADVADRMRWRTDVLPFQWRIAVSWMSGYFIFSMFTPVVFWRQGAVEAGRLGMALAVFSAVSAIGMSWVNAKSPHFSMHISRGERAELNALFKAVALRSITFTATASLAILALAWLLTMAGVPQISRFAAPSVLACMALVTTANSVVFAAAIYMRAHKEEPMLAVSLVTGLLVAAAAYFGSRIGVLPMMLLYSGITVLVSLPWTGWLLAKYWNRGNSAV